MTSRRVYAYPESLRLCSSLSTPVGCPLYSATARQKRIEKEREEEEEEARARKNHYTEKSPGDDDSASACARAGERSEGCRRRKGLEARAHVAARDSIFGACRLHAHACHSRL